MMKSSIKYPQVHPSGFVSERAPVDIECVFAPTSDHCAKWYSEISRAAADEPPTMRALDAIAYNQATFALIEGETPIIKVSLWQSLTRHIFAHNGGSFPLESFLKTE